MKAIDEAWTRIEAWLGQHAPKKVLRSLRGPATPEALDALEARLGRPLPRDVRASLLRHDGQKNDLAPLCGPHALLDLGGIEAQWSVMREALGDAWRPAWIPVGADGAGNLLYVDADEGAVRDYDHEEGHATWGPSWAAWLRSLADALEAGELAWDREYGLMGEDAEADFFGGEEWEPDPAVRAGVATLAEAQALADRGQKQEALALLDRAVEASPGFTGLRSARSILRADVGDLEGAADDLSRLAEHPEQALQLGLVRLLLGDAEGARGPLERARAAGARIEAFGQVKWTGPPFVLRAAALLADLDAGREPALERYDWTRRARHAVREGDDAAALAALDRALVFDENPSDWAERSRLRQAAGDLAGALSDLNEVSRMGGSIGTLEEAEAALAAAPDDAVARYRRGLLRYNAMDLVGAIMDFSRVLAASPGHPIVLAIRGLARFFRDDPKEAQAAKADLEQALAGFAPDQPGRDLVLDCIARIDRGEGPAP